MNPVRKQMRSPKQWKFRAPLIKVEGVETGQAILLIALLLVVVLGFTALAIDGGGLYLLLRDAQNAADAASLAAAYSKCADGDPTAIVLAGKESAASDGFDDASDDVDVQVFNNDPDGNSVRVTISANKQSYFARVVYSGPLSVSAESIGTCSNAIYYDGAKAVVALAQCSGPNSCDPGNTAYDSVDQSGSNIGIVGGVVSGCACDMNPGQIEDGLGCYSNPDGFDSCDDYHNQLVCSDPPEPVVLEDPPGDPFATFWKSEFFLLPDGKFAKWASVDDQCVQGVDTDASAPGYELYLGGQAGDSTTGCYHYISSSRDLGNNNTYYFEGLYYVNGDFEVNNFIVGTGGATFVTPSGRLSFQPGFSNVTFYNPGPAIDPSDPFCLNNPTDPQCIDPTPGNRHWYPLLFSGQNNCNNTAPGASISVNGSNAIWTGISYAPNGGCNWSGSNQDLYGAFVCRVVDLSGSQSQIIFNPDLLPPAEPSVRYSTGD